MGTSLTIEYELNLNVLRQSIYKAYERCEGMRIRFAYDKKEKQWYQYVVEKEEREIEYVDFSGCDVLFLYSTLLLNDSYTLK